MGASCLAQVPLQVHELSLFSLDNLREATDLNLGLSLILLKLRLHLESLALRVEELVVRLSEYLFHFVDFSAHFSVFVL